MTGWLRAALGVTLVGVLILALVPHPPEAITTGWDKSNHALAFAVLGVLGCLAFARRGWVIAGLLGYGGLIEVLQALTPTRSADWHDLVADGVGLLLGLGLCAVIRRVGFGRRR